VRDLLTHAGAPRWLIARMMAYTQAALPLELRSSAGVGVNVPQEVSMSIDWSAVFVPSIGLAEIVLRGTIMYLGLFAVMRFIGRRQAGNFGPADLLVIVLIADAAQNGLGKDYSSVTEGLILVITIVGWEYLIDWLQYRYPALRPILTAPSLTLIENGRVNQANLQRELLTEEELRAQLREKEVVKYDEVKLAKLEGDGRLSVIKARS
jgi:uncharacterized membrane protein YcaP (DUF421 family)